MGAWFDPFPSVADQAYWGVDDNSMRVSKWPRPNSNRVNCFFRFQRTFGYFPLPSRIYSSLRMYLVDPPPFPPSVEEAVWWDLVAVSEGLLEFVTDPSPSSGRVYSLTIEYFDILPTTGQHGELVTQRIDEGGEFYERESEYGEAPPNRTLFWKWNQFAALPPADSTLESQSAGWPYAFTIPLSMGVADCFTFPSLTPPPVGGFAEFNGVDAYVGFPADFPYSTPRFSCSFDIRPQQPAGQLTVNGLARFGSFGLLIQDLDSLQWWNRVIALSPGLTNGVWQTVTVEYDWSIPGAAYSVFIDALLVGTTVTSFTIAPWDQLGKRGTLIEGAFDLRNFVEYGGSPLAPVLRIDVPLIDDACSVIPLTQKGTTFNMALPSCP